MIICMNLFTIVFNYLICITWMNCIRFSLVIGIAGSGMWGIMGRVYHVSSR